MRPIYCLRFLIQFMSTYYKRISCLCDHTAIFVAFAKKQKKAEDDTRDDIAISVRTMSRS